MSSDRTQVVEDLLAFTGALMKGDFSKRLTVNAEDRELAEVCMNLNAFADNLQINPPSNFNSQIAIQDFIDVISSYANRNFEKKLPISEHSNFIDALATGINILGEELEYTTFSRLELENERNELRAAKESAEEASRLKSAFLGNLSHEIRTPLQGIFGFAELLEMPNLTNDQRQSYLSIIKRRTSDLQNIVESLLDLAILESGNLGFLAGKTNLKAQLEEIAGSFEEEFRVGGKKLEFSLHNRVPSQVDVHLDATHLKRVVINLMNNALKFTHEGSLTLAASIDGEIIEISVSDTGMGIPQEKLDLIFEPFRQAHEGVSRQLGGVGLGLAISKKMVEAWGGNIRVESTVGVGSKFSFTIPISSN
jgi:signal transduction histidine kinase